MKSRTPVIKVNGDYGGVPCRKSGQRAPCGTVIVFFVVFHPKDKRGSVFCVFSPTELSAQMNLCLPAQSQDYCAVDCEFTFLAWGPCDQSCGGGTMYRKMVVTQQPGYGGKACPKPEDSKSCNTDYCPVDCAYSDFGDWSNCSKQCGYGGEVHRERKVTTSAEYGGAACPHL